MLLTPLRFVFFLAIFVALNVLNNGQTYYYLGKGDTCSGTGYITTSSARVFEVIFDIHEIYKPGGWSKGDSNLSPTHMYSFTLCGQLVNSSCSGDWCFEEVNKTNKSACEHGLARWEETDFSNIRYYAIFNSTILDNGNLTYFNSTGVHVSVTNLGETGNINCTNELATVNYNLRCREGSNVTQLLSLYENYTDCVWNVSFYSPYGCVNASVYTSKSSSSSGTVELSAGSVILIVVVLIALAYLILGCAYNSFYHGRVGMDALPNKDSWSLCCRYVKAGCQATKDTLCCCCSSQKSNEFQHL